MCILRNDYMIDSPQMEPKLVEFNTIACGMGILCQKVKESQNYIREKYEKDIKFNYKELNMSERVNELIKMFND